MDKKPIASRLPTTVRVGAVITAFSIGALLAIGCLIAVMFEAEGFGSTDNGPRGWYITLLAAGLIACVGVPFLILRWMLPHATTRAPLYFSIAVGVVLMLFGLSVKP